MQVNPDRPTPQAARQREEDKSWVGDVQEPSINILLMEILRTCIQRRTTRERSPPIASSPLSTAQTTFSSVGEVGGSVKKGEERGVVWKESEKVVSSHELGKLLF